MNNAIFLLDTNILLDSFKRFYHFDIAPGFWELMEIHINNGNVILLDKVVNEIIKDSNDRLTTWINGFNHKIFIKHSDKDIIEKYGEILNYIQENPCYKETALHSWAKENIADAWLIATASVKKYTLVTHENSNLGLNPKNPSKSAKIPDIAKYFQVKTTNLFYVMKQLQFKLIR